ncbi:helix-turn-helix transcriptional regulator [Agromyces sp. CCNWLW203]|uniref:helix-turn-helix transcriptional regulator n=1 Tax=Agromyces sp. CCNWLW203 TaxID=3112842 RepID=UPI002F964186
MRTDSERSAPDAAAEAHRLLETARREARAGSRASAWAACRAAAAIGRRTGDAVVVATAATLLTDRELVEWRTAPDRQAMCVEALRMLGAPGDDDPITRALRERVEAQLEALSTGWAEHVAVSRERLSPADVDERFASLRVAHGRAVGPGAAAARLVMADEAMAIGRAGDDDEVLAYGRLWRLDSLVQLGRRLEFNTTLGEFSGLVERLASPTWTWRLANVHACLALLEDRLDDVPAAVAAAERAGVEAGVSDAAFFDLILRSHVAQRTGVGVARVEAEVRAVIVDGPLLAQGWRAVLLADLGRADEAVAVWHTLAPHIAELPPESNEVLVATVGHARLAILADDRERAAVVLELLRPYAHLHVAGPATTPYGGPVSLTLAALANYLGDRVAARDWADDARERAEAMGAPWFVASSRAVLRGGTTLAPLSPRETEVARRVAAGDSNRAIADSLFLSERTVEQHVRNIMHKLALPNRTAVATWVARSGR